ncbi:MAG: hypothetical protein ACP5PQ_07250 [Thermoproteota archaeon]
MSYTKRLTESEVKYGFIRIGGEFIDETSTGWFTLDVRGRFWRGLENVDSTPTVAAVE